MLVLIGNQLCLALESSRSNVFTAYEQYSFEINASDTADEDTQGGDDDDDWEA
jgi:hypothetical protein